MFPFPLDFSARRIDRPQRAPERRGIIVGKIRAAVIRMPSLVGLRGGAENVALFARGHVKQAGLRVKRWRHPVGRAGGTRANAAAVRSRGRFLVDDGTPLRVLAAAPSNFRI